MGLAGLTGLPAGARHVLDPGSQGVCVALVPHEFAATPPRERAPADLGGWRCRRRSGDRTRLASRRQ
jgi:hypothetical protein